MPSRWRRRAQFLGTLWVLAGLLACGGNSGSVGETDPPGRVIAGTGAVASGDEAAARLVAQYLGLASTRQGGPVIGTGDDPAVGLFSLAAEPLPRGTTIRPFFDTANYVLNREYFTFFLDPNLIAEFEHLAYYLYVRPSDGAIFEQTVHSWPVVNGTDRLDTEADRRANVVYIHEDFQVMLDPPAARQAPVLSGASTGALIVCAGEDRRQGDIDNAAEYMQDLTGEANPLSVLWHKHPDEVDEDDFARKLRESSEGLGAGDKYFLFLATHGSRPPNSKVQIGNDFLTYEELCKLINDNVTAGHINILNGACYSGNMHAVFEQWDAQTDKGIQWFAGSDATHPGYAYPDNLSLKCALMQLKDALAAAREDGTVTLAEIEDAMKALELTADEILKKICEAAGIAEDDPDPPEWKEDLERDDPGADEFPRPGEPGTGGFDPAPPPVEIPQHILDLLDALRRARLADDPIQLGPLYDPNYNYDGQTHQQITQVNPSFDVTAFTIGPIRLDILGLGGDDIVIVDIDRDIEVRGTQPIRSEQQGTRVFEIDPTEPQDILSERLARWAQQDFGGAGGLVAQPPGGPVIQEPVVVGGTPFQVDSFFDVFVEIHLPDHPGNIRVSGGVTFQPRQRQFTGTQVDGVFASLAGNTVQLQREGSTDIYSGDIAVPRQLGRWVLSFSASTRVVNGQTGDYVSSAAGRSVEVRVVP